MEEIKVDFNRIWINSICFSTDIGFSKANKKRTCWDKKVIKSNNCWKKIVSISHILSYFYPVARRWCPPFFHHSSFYGYRGQTKCMCLILCVCMRYWMDSIYNWMFLSSLTIILPSMTPLFNLFAALNGYYFWFCLFYIAIFFLSCFYHAVSCSINVIFPALRLFCHCSRSDLFPVCGFFFCVSVCF